MRRMTNIEHTTTHLNPQAYLPAHKSCEAKPEQMRRGTCVRQQKGRQTKKAPTFSREIRPPLVRSGMIRYGLLLAAVFSFFAVVDFWHGAGQGLTTQHVRNEKDNDTTLQYSHMLQGAMWLGSSHAAAKPGNGRHTMRDEAKARRRPPALKSCTASTLTNNNNHNRKYRIQINIPWRVAHDNADPSPQCATTAKKTTRPPVLQRRPLSRDSRAQSAPPNCRTS